jgi:hypothetical protein
MAVVVFCGCVGEVFVNVLLLVRLAVGDGFGDCVGTPNSTNCKGGIEVSVGSLKSDITSASGGTVVANASESAFCVSTTLKSDTAQHICVDATGQFAEGASGCGAGTACP